MPVILRILLGLATMGVGMGLVIKSRVVFGMVGPIRWAENKLGPGQTDTFIKIVGIIIIFIGIAIATNIISGMLESFAGVFNSGV